MNFDERCNRPWRSAGEARGPSKMKSGYSYNTPVVTLNCPSLMEFEEKCVRAQTPCVIRGAMGHWPALTKWKDFNYLRNLAGGRTVPVEQGIFTVVILVLTINRLRM